MTKKTPLEKAQELFNDFKATETQIFEIKDGVPSLDITTSGYVMILPGAAGSVTVQADQGDAFILSQKGNKINVEQNLSFAPTPDPENSQPSELHHGGIHIINKGDLTIGKIVSTSPDKTVDVVGSVSRGPDGSITMNAVHSDRSAGLPRLIIKIPEGGNLTTCVSDAGIITTMVRHKDVVIRVQDQAQVHCTVPTTGDIRVKGKIIQKQPSPV